MKMVEKIARALYEDWVNEHPDIEFAPWENLGDKLTWIDRAGAALRALEVPTEGMVEAGMMGLSNAGLDDARTDDAKFCWSAMIAAAREE